MQKNDEEISRWERYKERSKRFFTDCWTNGMYLWKRVWRPLAICIIIFVVVGLSVATYRGISQYENAHQTETSTAPAKPAPLMPAAPPPPPLPPQASPATASAQEMKSNTQPASAKKPQQKKPGISIVTMEEADTSIPKPLASGATDHPLHDSSTPTPRESAAKEIPRPPYAVGQRYFPESGTQAKIIPVLQECYFEVADTMECLGYFQNQTGETIRIDLRDGTASLGSHDMTGNQITRSAGIWVNGGQIYFCGENRPIALMIMSGDQPSFCMRFKAGGSVDRVKLILGFAWNDHITRETIDNFGNGIPVSR